MLAWGRSSGARTRQQGGAGYGQRGVHVVTEALPYRDAELDQRMNLLSCPRAAACLRVSAHLLELVAPCLCP